MRLSAQLGIAIPVFNAPEHFKRCIDSVLKHTSAEYGIGVFDDASTDLKIREITETLQKNHANIQYFRSPQQLGFVENANTALNQFKNDVILLNSDCVVGPDWLERLLNGYNNLSKPGIVCPVSNNATLLTVTTHQKADVLGNLLIANADIQPADPILIPVAVGFCMLISRAMIDTIGNLDPVFNPGYGEEVDWSMRALRAGFEIAAIPDVMVLHSGSASFNSEKTISEVRQENDHLIKVKWPEYSAMVRSWWKMNPLRSRIEQLDAKSRDSKRKLIVHLVHRMGSAGGTEIITRQLIDGLSEQFDHLVIFPTQPHMDSWADAVETRPSKHVRYLSWNRSYANSKILVQGSPADLEDRWVEYWLTTVLQAQKPDVVHIHHLYGWGTFKPVELIHALGIPLVYSLHDFHLMCPDYNQIGIELRPCKKKIIEISDGCSDCLKSRMLIQGSETKSIKQYITARRQLIRSQLECISIFISPSQYLKDRFERAFGSVVMHKTQVIPHAVKHPEHKVASSTSSGSFKCVMLGGFKFLKGIETVIQAAAQLPEDIEIDIYGMPGDSFDLIREMPENCSYQGGYSVDQVSDVLLNADVVLIPSLFEETFSLVLSEAWAHGKGVIATDRGALSERIRDGENGWLYEPGNADQLAGLIRAAAQQRDSDQFTIETTANLKNQTLEIWLNSYLKIYDRLVLGLNETDSIKPSPAFHSIDRRMLELGWQKRISTAMETIFVAESSRSSRSQKKAGTIAAVLWINSEAVPAVVESALERRPTKSPAHYWLVPDGYLCPATDGSETPEWVYYDEHSLARIIKQLNIDLVLPVSMGDRLYDKPWSEFLSNVHLYQAFDVFIFDHDHCDRTGYRYAPVMRGCWDNHLAKTTTELDAFIAIRPAVLDKLQSNSTKPIGKLLADIDSVSDLFRFTHIPAVIGSRLDWNHNNAKQHVIHNTCITPLRDAAIQIVVIEDAGLNALEQTLRSLKKHSEKQVLVLTNTDESYSKRWPTQWKWFNDSKQLSDQIDDSQHVMAIRAGIIVNWDSDIQTLITRLDSAGSFAIGLNVTDFLGANQSGFEVVGNSAGPMVSDRPWPGGKAVESVRFQAVSQLTGDAVGYKATTIKTMLSVRNIRNFSEYREQITHLDAALLDCSTIVGRKSFLDRNNSSTLTNNTEVDPLFSKKLSLISPFWEVDRQAATVSEDLTSLPVLLCITPDHWASSQYRLRQPVRHLQSTNRISRPAIFTLSERPMPIFQEILRLNPTAVLFHNVFSHKAIELINQLKQHSSQTKVVFLQDDLITELPDYHPLFGNQSDDLQERIETVHHLADRVVFSTKRLASNYDLPNGHVVSNSVDPEEWPAQRLRNARPIQTPLRIAWTGAHQHEGDLRLLRNVMKHTHHKVDWILFGLSPAYLRPYAKEFHDMIQFDEYPEKLHSLNIDLAVVPLQDNEFNRCKSNVKLLELGILGIPVIASKRAPYLDAPVCLVDEDPEDWIEQIFNFDADRSRLTKHAAVLNGWVESNHLIEHRLSGWRAALGL